MTSRLAVQLWACGTLCGLLMASPVLAAGITFTELGAKSLSMGGAFTGLADDVSAIKFNPAGLVQLSGTHFILEGQLLNHEVSFQRTDKDGNTSKSDEIRNTGGLFFSPLAAAAQGLEVGGRRLTVAVGIYPPPSVGRYAYPEPNYTREGSSYVENPRKFAPQRYALISSNTVVLFPTLSAGYAIHERFSAGVSVQYVYSSFKFRRSVSSQLFTPDKQSAEDPGFDSVASVDLVGKPTVTGVLGLRAQPIDSLAIGASFRPPLPIAATGNFRVEPGPIPTQLGLLVKGDQADLALTFPMELRLGAAFAPKEGKLQPLTVTADFVYEGWQSFDELVITPKDVTIQLGEDAPATKLADVRIPKNFTHAFSVRAGAQWAFDFGLKVRGGLMFEKSAMRREYTSIDFAHFDRYFFTAGASYPVGPIEIIGAFAYVPTVTRFIRESEVRSANTDATVQGGVVGNGDFRSGGWNVAFGLRGAFGQEPKQTGEIDLDDGNPDRTQMENQDS